MIGSEKYLTTNECAKLSKRTPGAIRNLVLRRAIPYRKVSGRLVFLINEIQSWIENAPGVRLKDLE
jgi:hypothetical protein